MKSPGRRATAKALQGRFAEGLFYRMNNAPEAVEQDKVFYALFGEWARKGRNDKVLEARMKQRWAEIMAQKEPDGNGSTAKRLGRARGRIAASSAR